MELIQKASLVELTTSLHNGQLPLLEYIDQFCDRLEIIEPEILAFVPEEKVRERLRREAILLMQRYPHSEDRPPLYGVIVGIKDVFHAQGFLTRAGSNLPPEVLTGTEASVVTALRSAGALIAGKTITEEFAYGSLTPTRNPHNLNHTPGGSSAGSAAAVAAGICSLAIGTQTLVSTIGPASFCGVVGFKPSYDRIAMDGSIQFSRSMDTLGLFTQDVASMKLACSVLMTDFRLVSASKKPVLGIPKGVYLTMLYEGTYDVFQKQISSLQNEGYIVREVDMPWEDDFIYGDFMLHLIQAEMAEVHKNWITTYSPLYGQGVRKFIHDAHGIPQQEVKQTRNGQITLRLALEQTMQQAGVDVWVSPAQAGPAPERSKNETGRSGMTSLWTYAGVPTITIPGATINGMPLGFQCMGVHGKDEELLQWAKGIEANIRKSLIEKNSSKNHS